MIVTAAALEVALRVRARHGEHSTRELPEALGEREIYRPSDDPVLGYELAPGARARTANGIEIAINAAGFRGPDVAPAPDAGRVRIAMLGGSEVFGEKLTLDETLPHALERALSLRDGGAFEVLDLGVVGYTTPRAIRLYTTRARKLGARLVVLHPTTFDALAPDEVASQDAWDASYLVRTARQFAMMWRGAKLLSSPAGYAAFVAERFAPGGAARAALIGEVERFASEVRADGARLVVIVSPELFGLRTRAELASTPYRAFHEAVGALASRGIDVLDPLPALIECAANPPELWVSPDDHHRNARANRCIADFVAASGVLAGRPGPAAAAHTDGS